MSRLIPEKRVDKNGRAVTRHVLNDTAPPVSAKSLPAPASTAEKRPVSKFEYAVKIADFFFEWEDNYEKQLAIARYETQLSISSLRKINAWINALDPENERDAEIFDQVLTRILKREEDSPSSSNRMVTILVESMPVMTRFLPDHNANHLVALETVNGANYAAKVNRVVIDGRNVTEEERQMFHWMVFELMVKKINTSRDHDFLREEGRWFSENMDALAAHAKTVIKRGTTDREFLHDLISKDSSTALAEGTL